FVKTEAIRYGKVKKAILKYADKGKIVIYCTRVCDVEEMRDYLIEDCDIEADEIAICHSKLSNRAKQEQRFRSGKAHIMIATSAFGMGINIPDIRLIIVSQLPFSAASFYQMAGRAGRDGKRAKALLLWNDADFQMNLDIISNTDERAIDAVNELYAICESSDDLHDAVIGCFAKEGE
uniref:helicase-related protein n=1 Tax=Agathobaculum sp. TaxID=2048138 RepID=UPI003AB1BC6E